MGFFKGITSSIYNPHFYSQIKHQNLFSVFKYFFLFILLLTTVNVLVLSYELGVRVPQSIKSFINDSVLHFPSDLEVNINKGQVSTNVTEPFFVPFPKSDTASYQSLNNLLVIDTKTPFSSTQFDQYKTMFWVTKDSVFYANREYDTRSIPLEDFHDVKINKGFVQDLVNKASPLLNMLGPVFILLTFIGLFLGFTFNLIYMLFLALLIFFLSAILKWELNYSASFKTAIYACTLAFIVDLILFNTGIYTGFYGFPFLFTLIALCITTINFQSQDHN